MTTDQHPRTLLVGYGNPGRLDDGLGPALAAEIEKQSLPNLTVDSDYQLTVEHAHAVAEHDIVIFADASVSAPDPFTFEKLDPRKGMGFTTHGVEPQEVLALAHDLFGSKTVGYVLAIRGHEFDEFSERLSEKAQANLAKAVECVREFVESRGQAPGT